MWTCPNCRTEIDEDDVLTCWKCGNERDAATPGKSSSDDELAGIRDRIKRLSQELNRRPDDERLVVEREQLLMKKICLAGAETAEETELVAQLKETILAHKRAHWKHRDIHDELVQTGWLPAMAARYIEEVRREVRAHGGGKVAKGVLWILAGLVAVGVGLGVERARLVVFIGPLLAIVGIFKMLNGLSLVAKNGAPFEPGS